MPLLAPFTGIRPVPERATEVVAPPYDVLNTAEAKVRAEGKPHSFLHISKPEIDLPEGTDPYSPEVYAKAAENMNAMLDAGILFRDAEPHYYIYRLTMGHHVQTGIVGGASVLAYDDNRVRKHEFTRPTKEDDRVRQIEAVNAQTGPVMLAHRTLRRVKAVIDEVTLDHGPVYDVTADDGIRHTLWVVDNLGHIERVTTAYDSLEAIYIADGHHRSAAASRVATARREGDPDPTGSKPYDRFLVMCFPAEEMLILDYNRVVKDLNGMSPDKFLARLAGHFKIEEMDGEAKPARKREFGMYLDGKWYRMTYSGAVPDSGSPADALDVALLQSSTLDPLLGIKDPRTDDRIDFVGGMRGLGELARRVDNGEMAVAFALFPTSMDDLFSVAEAGQVMPPKSTWFEPKLADGLVSLPLD